MPEEIKEACKSCKFFVPHNDISGECRAHAPIISNEETCYPHTVYYEFCGDYVEAGFNMAKYYGWEHLKGGSKFKEGANAI